MEYCWSTYQSEWATDIVFRNPPTLARLYPKLILHGLTTCLSPDVKHFLGRKVPASGNVNGHVLAAVVSDMRYRPEGVRIKHRVGDNSVKVYDMQSSVLRVETTINDVDDFNTFHTPENRPDAEPSWQNMRKGAAGLHRLAAVSHAANTRNLGALASVENTASLGELTTRLCRLAYRLGRWVRALNPHTPGDAALIAASSLSTSSAIGTCWHCSSRTLPHRRKHVSSGPPRCRARCCCCARIT